jgi:hypothetical protein
VYPSCDSAHHALCESADRFWQSSEWEQECASKGLGYMPTSQHHPTPWGPHLVPYHPCKVACIAPKVTSKRPHPGTAAEMKCSHRYGASGPQRQDGLIRSTPQGLSDAMQNQSAPKAYRNALCCAVQNQARGHPRWDTLLKFGLQTSGKKIPGCNANPRNPEGDRRLSCSP